MVFIVNIVSNRFKKECISLFFYLDLITLLILVKIIFTLILKLDFIKVSDKTYQSYLQIYGVRLDDQKVFLHTNPFTIVMSIHIFLTFYITTK